MAVGPEVGGLYDCRFWEWGRFAEACSWRDNVSRRGPMELGYSDISRRDGVELTADSPA